MITKRISHILWLLLALLAGSSTAGENEPLPWGVTLHYHETPPSPGAGAAQVTIALRVKENRQYEWSYDVGPFREQKDSHIDGQGRLTDKQMASLIKVITEADLINIQTNFVSTGLVGDEEGWGGSITLENSQQKKAISFETRGSLDKGGAAVSQVVLHLKNLVAKERDKKLEKTPAGDFLKAAPEK